MAKSEQQRQKKLSRKKAKDRQKQQRVAREKQQLASLSGKMTAAAGGKVLHAMVGEPGDGMATVLFARQASGGQIAFAVLLIDTYCLGVKNAIGAYRTPVGFNEMLGRLVDDHELKSVSPGIARGLVEASIAYAGLAGFAPHSDYRKLQPIWGEVEPESVDGIYEFGKDGKPFYIAGPHEDLASQNLVLAKLDAAFGPGEYDFLVGGLSGMGGDFSEFEALDDFDADDFDADDFDLDGQVEEAGGFPAIVDGAVVSRRANSAE